MQRIRDYLPVLKEFGVILSAAAGALLGVYATASGSWDRNRELDIKMLEISLSILREDPEKSQIKATRGWAVDLINKVSPVPIPPDVREDLISKKLDWVTRIFPGRIPTKQDFVEMLEEFEKKQIRGSDPPKAK